MVRNMIVDAVHCIHPLYSFRKVLAHCRTFHIRVWGLETAFGGISHVCPDAINYCAELGIYRFNIASG